MRPTFFSSAATDARALATVSAGASLGSARNSDEGVVGGGVASQRVVRRRDVELDLRVGDQRVRGLERRQRARVVASLHQADARAQLGARLVTWIGG